MLINYFFSLYFLIISMYYAICQMEIIIIILLSLFFNQYLFPSLKIWVKENFLYFRMFCIFLILLFIKKNKIIWIIYYSILFYTRFLDRIFSIFPIFYIFNLKKKIISLLLDFKKFWTKFLILPISISELSKIYDKSFSNLLFHFLILNLI